MPVFMGPDFTPATERDAVAGDPAGTDTDEIHRVTANADCPKACCDHCIVPVDNCKIVLIFEGCSGHKFDDFEVRINGVLVATVPGDFFATTCSPGGLGDPTCFFEYIEDDACAPHPSGGTSFQGTSGCYCPGSGLVAHPNSGDLDQFLDEKTLEINLTSATNNGCTNKIKVHVCYNSGCLTNFDNVQVKESVLIEAAAGALDHTILVDNPCKDCQVQCGVLCEEFGPPGYKVTIYDIADFGGCPCSDLNGVFSPLPFTGDNSDQAVPSGIPHCYWGQTFTICPPVATCIAGTCEEPNECTIVRIYVDIEPGLVTVQSEWTCWTQGQLSSFSRAKWNKSFPAGKIDCLTPMILNKSFSISNGCDFANSKVLLEPA